VKENFIYTFRIESWDGGIMFLLLVVCIAIWLTHISGRVHAVGLVVRIEIYERCYTSTIECYVIGTSWFISCVINVEVIIMGMTIELSRYGGFEPEEIDLHILEMFLHLSFVIIEYC
jgi:hypothetical protein